MNPFEDRARVDAILLTLGSERGGMKLGLDGMARLLVALGSPERVVPVVLVAGSNGKGSTAALLSSMVHAAGARVGLYTSPHLERVEERVRIDGAPISSGDLADRLERIVAASHELDRCPTYFEAMTAAGFLTFAEAPVDLAVVEVGIGGRLDATNLAEPILSLVASISLEHTDILGSTLAEIAREKAGIFRLGRPAIAWGGEPEADPALHRAAQEIGARFYFGEDHVRIRRRTPLGWDGQEVELETDGDRYTLPIALAGEHQAKNLGLAVAAAEELRALGVLGAHDLDSTAIARGAADCRWPGRLESIVLPDGRRVILDAAHNPEGAAVFARFLAERGEPYDLLFGALVDKDAEAMLAPLAARAHRITLTAPRSERARNPHALAAHLGRGEIQVIEDPAQALEAALAGAKGRVLAICGSIYLVGELRGRLVAGEEKDDLSP